MVRLRGLGAAALVCLLCARLQAAQKMQWPVAITPTPNPNLGPNAQQEWHALHAPLTQNESTLLGLMSLQNIAPQNRAVLRKSEAARKALALLLSLPDDTKGNHFTEAGLYALLAKGELAPILPNVLQDLWLSRYTNRLSRIPEMIERYDDPSMAIFKLRTMARIAEDPELSTVDQVPHKFGPGRHDVLDALVEQRGQKKLLRIFHFTPNPSLETFKRELSSLQAASAQSKRPVLLVINSLPPGLKRLLSAVSFPLEVLHLPFEHNRFQPVFSNVRRADHRPGPLQPDIELAEPVMAFLKDIDPEVAIVIRTTPSALQALEGLLADTRFMHKQGSRLRRILKNPEILRSVAPLLPAIYRLRHKPGLYKLLHTLSRALDSGDVTGPAFHLIGAAGLGRVISLGPEPFGHEADALSEWDGRERMVEMKSLLRSEDGLPTVKEGLNQVLAAYRRTGLSQVLVFAVSLRKPEDPLAIRQIVEAFLEEHPELPLQVYVHRFRSQTFDRIVDSGAKSSLPRIGHRNGEHSGPLRSRNRHVNHVLDGGSSWPFRWPQRVRNSIYAVNKSLYSRKLKRGRR